MGATHNPEAEALAWLDRVGRANGAEASAHCQTLMGMIEQGRYMIAVMAFQAGGELRITPESTRQLGVDGWRLERASDPSTGDIVLRVTNDA